MRAVSLLFSLVSLLGAALVATAEPALKTKDGGDLKYMLANGVVCESQATLESYLGAEQALAANPDDIQASARRELLEINEQCFRVPSIDNEQVVVLIIKITGEVSRMKVGSVDAVVLKGEPIHVFTRRGNRPIVDEVTVYTITSADAFDTMMGADKPKGLPI